MEHEIRHLVLALERKKRRAEEAGVERLGEVEGTKLARLQRIHELSTKIRLKTFVDKEMYQEVKTASQSPASSAVLHFGTSKEMYTHTHTHARTHSLTHSRARAHTHTQLMSKHTTAEEAVELLEEVKSKLKRRENHCHKQMVLDGALWNEEVVSMCMCCKTNNTLIHA